MPRDLVQIYVCQNPDCGLRYPVVVPSTYSERCPVCLGKTKSVIKQSLYQDQLEDQDQTPANPELSVLLDNIRSGLNVGSIFRSADGFGFHQVYLCGITPTPENPEVSKSAVGAMDFVKWSVHKNAVDLIEKLKKQNNKIWVMEKTKNSVPIQFEFSKLSKKQPLVLVVGNEISGVDPGILELADCLVYIPMHGQKRSFNVAVAFAVAAQIIQSGY